MNTLSDADNLLFLQVHAAKHLWERLFWLWDLAVFNRRPDAPPTAELMARSRDFGLERPVLAGLALAREFLDLEVAEEFHDLDRDARRLAIGFGSVAGFNGREPCGADDNSEGRL